jgi:integrase
MYRHGLRASEAVALRWDQVDLKAGRLHVNRLKNGVPSTHPLRGPELRQLRELRRDYTNPKISTVKHQMPKGMTAVRSPAAWCCRLVELPQ